MLAADVAAGLDPAAAVIGAWKTRIVRSGSHRYNVDRRAVPSVTQILRALDKPALVAWSSRCATQAYSQAAYELQQQMKDWPEWKVSAVLEAHVGERPPYQMVMKKTAGLGTQVHDAIESHLKGRAPHFKTDKVKNCFESWLGWWKKANYHPIAAECAVAYVDQTTGPLYAGTLDLLARDTKTNRLFCLDWKTGSGIYDEAKLQSVAYREALRMMGVTEPIEGLLVHIPREGGPTKPHAIVDNEQVLLVAFLALIKVHLWQTDALRP